MEQITFETVKRSGWLIFEAITGSRAYGLATANSDTDIRGVFILPKDIFYSLGYVQQVSNSSNDIVYYELGRFIELLNKNNPNIMELLNVPDDCVLYRHPLMDMIKPEMFISKLCEQTFANYAYSQIQKATGLEKKIMQPMEKERKSVLDFCFVHKGKRVFTLNDFLQVNGFSQEDIGLSAATHFKDCYNMFHDVNGNYSGVVKKDFANDVCLSNIPKEADPVGLLYFNKDGYSVYCKKYKEYWDWVAKRNQDRYETTMSHGKKYDSKNMMHVFRLLQMAKEIAQSGNINVIRHDREFLLSIKRGEFEYDALIDMAKKMKQELTDLYSQSNLPEMPNAEEVNKLLASMRNSLYA